MELNDREKDLLEALSGTAKSALSLIPGLGQAIAGWDAYKRSSFDRNLKNTISHLKNKVDDFESFFSDDWIKSEEGQQFARKVFDSAFDAQMEDKQELFINALINGVRDKETTNLEKLKFVDILRHLSLSSLMILADMHSIFKNKVKRPGRSGPSLDGSPFVDPSKIAQELSNKYHPYLINAAIYEMESQGLFSNIHEWRKATNGKYVPETYFNDALSYTDFTFRFVEFITTKEQSKQLSAK
ncbi:MAG: hypothetical protein JRH09_18995 [Deltaproteobacteria bacterium]|nr:hypothetical protein [Deltaproteobacteria bacterium]